MVAIVGLKFYRIQEVAEALHVTPQTVKAWIKRGKLKWQRVGRPILIEEGSLRQFLQS